MEEHELPLPRALLRGLGYLLVRGRSFRGRVSKPSACGCLWSRQECKFFSIGSRRPLDTNTSRRASVHSSAPCVRAFVNTAVLLSHNKTHTHLDRSTPSSLGQWDQPYDSLDEIQESVAREARGGGRAAPGADGVLVAEGQVQLDKTVMSASYAELDDMVLSRPLR
jgi:hypothetical protein